MIRMVAIKPAGFKEKSFQHWFGWAIKETIEMADREFAKTYQTFRRQPKFVKEYYEGRDGIAGSTSTDDENYVRLNEGTPGGYPIPTAGPGILAFQTGYKPKTVPGVLYSASGGPFGPTIVRNTQVIHPGIEARKFDLAVRQRVEPWFKHRQAIAMKRAAKESGHSI